MPTKLVHHKIFGLCFGVSGANTISLVVQQLDPRLTTCLKREQFTFEPIAYFWLAEETRKGNCFSAFGKTNVY